MSAGLLAVDEPIMADALSGRLPDATSFTPNAQGERRPYSVLVRATS